MIEIKAINSIISSNTKRGHSARMAYVKGQAGKQKVSELNIAIMQIDGYLKSTASDEKLNIRSGDLIKRFNKIKEFLCVD